MPGVSPKGGSPGMSQRAAHLRFNGAVGAATFLQFRKNESDAGGNAPWTVRAPLSRGFTRQLDVFTVQRADFFRSEGPFPGNGMALAVDLGCEYGPIAVDTGGEVRAGIACATQIERAKLACHFFESFHYEAVSRGWTAGQPTLIHCR